VRAIELARRRQVIAAWHDGMPLADVARSTQVSVWTVRRWVARWRTTGAIEPRHPPGRPRCIPAQAADEIGAMVVANPTAPVAALCQIWHQRTGPSVSTATMSRTLARYGWVKRTLA
jgi:transposase